jgi:transposase
VSDAPTLETPEVLVTHRNARTTVYARRLIVERFLAGWPAARIAEQLGVSRATVYKWIRRYRAEGRAGLADRSSRPHRSPGRVSAEVEDRVLALRATARRGPVFLARELGLVASTVGRILRRRQVMPLRALDPITGIPIRRQHSGRRYEHPRPGDLVHIDVKKLGRVPDGGGWRLHGRSEEVRSRGIGYDSSTLPSTTTPGSPTSKPCPTNATSRPRISCAAPPHGSQATA